MTEEQQDGLTNLQYIFAIGEIAVVIITLLFAGLSGGNSILPVSDYNWSFVILIGGSTVAIVGFYIGELSKVKHKRVKS